MSTKEEMTPLGRPVPELPVIDVERAQQHYIDTLGFELGWLYEGAVLRSLLAGLRWVGTEAGKTRPVHIASEDENLVEDLKQGLSFVRGKKVV